MERGEKPMGLTQYSLKAGAVSTPCALIAYVMRKEKGGDAPIWGRKADCLQIDKRL